ncbi:9810_t:CDS:10 [Diversispora eburnea]|uniref:Ribosomal RNA-processing protein 44 n=1 Tax=Diversispora eburnea TaxID=1213867 RepID=A0A9N8VD78_9GLOM|nr:9810_t:CDS:10 [Diversispora eburnea]
MLYSKTYLKRTKKGNAVKVVKEHYLRDDIWCYVENCTFCKHTEPALLEEARSTKLLKIPHYIVPDTNVLLNQMDIIKHPAINNVIILQTVYEELRHLNLSIYQQLRTLINEGNRHFFVFSNEHHRDTYIERSKGETPNDRNDRAIRSAVRWYSLHLKKASYGNKKIDVALLTDDVANREKAKAEGLLAFSELVEMIRNEGKIGKDRKVPYDDHLTASKIESGIKSGKLLQGTLNINIHNYLEVNGVETQIIILGRSRLNRAIQGDVIAVELLPKSEWTISSTAVVLEEEEETTELNEEIMNQSNELNNESAKTLQPTGKVVGIIKRNLKGSATSNIAENVLISPLDRRIPKLTIRTRQAHNLMSQRTLIAIDSWPKNAKYPLGHFVRVLGPAGDKSTETEVLLLEHDISHQEFSPRVLSNLPEEGENWKVTDEHLRDRMDLRHLNVCSIDPPGCTDIDDALHVRSLPNGNYEVGVHIADVTHFVKPNTALNEEAESRGTTVYLVDKRIDMLPELLGTKKVDRLAFSCIWELNSEAEILNVKFVKSVISSKASLTYEEAQLRIDDKRARDGLTKGIRILNQLAKKLRQRRLERGALTLASPEVRFKLENDSQDPVDVELIKALTPYGMSLTFESSKSLSDSLEKAVLPEDPYFNKLLRILTTRCMTSAVYFSAGSTVAQEYKHYGLAADFYTHFTSPIRRYSDIIVHRMLAVAIDFDKSYSSELTDMYKVQKICDNLNYRHRMAQMAASSSVELHTYLFFKGKLEREEAYVVKILKNGFIVLVPRYGIEGIVYSATKKSAAAAASQKHVAPITYNVLTNSLESTLEDGQKISIKLFDRVIVQIKKPEKERK